MNLKPFNLEEALANPNRVVTRDGRKVTQLTNFKIGNPLCLVGVVDYKIKSWKKSGRYFDDESSNDLFLLPQTKTVWVVVSSCSRGIYSNGFDSEIEAINFINVKAYTYYSKPTPIEIEI